MAIQYERYIARVTGNEDPDKRGRIKVVCPDLTGYEEVELPDWVDPLLDWSWWLIPDIDELVEIEVLVSADEDELPFQSAIFDPVVRWRGKRYYGGADTEAPRPVPDLMTESNYPKRRGLFTPNGHALMLDDTVGDEQVQLRWHAVEDEEDKYAFMALDIHGITLANKQGSLISLDSDNGVILIQDKNGNVITTSDEGIKAIDAFGNMVVLRDGVIEIMSQGGVTVSAANNVDVTCDIANLLAASEVNLGDGATDPVVLGNQWKTLFEGHQHPTGMGPSGAPLPGVPILTDLCLSQKVNTE